MAELSANTRESSPKVYEGNRRLGRDGIPYRILLGVTGSVAAVKGPEIAVRLAQQGMHVRVVLTQAGDNFWAKSKEYDPKHWSLLQEIICRTPPCTGTSQSTPENNTDVAAKDNDIYNNSCSSPIQQGSITVNYAQDEWTGWDRVGDNVLHIDLREWADMAVVAPLSAHTLAKLANGFCDDTLSCAMRAWDFGHGKRPPKPIVLAPAMNTAMWEHPLTQSQLNTVKGFGKDTSKTTTTIRVQPWNKNIIHVVEPQVKMLACGEVGTGALAAVDDILKAVYDSLFKCQDISPIPACAGRVAGNS